MQTMNEQYFKKTIITFRHKISYLFLLIVLTVLPLYLRLMSHKDVLFIPESFEALFHALSQNTSSFSNANDYVLRFLMDFFRNFSDFVTPEAMLVLFHMVLAVFLLLVIRRILNSYEIPYFVGQITLMLF
ncbi:hypothetical protein JW868_01800, partial [Candidatus Woesearchaeota archaeon]|nr:hypothetical protein [Candidatus Woesearchaeota archaeon]